ncbi:GyrI-like domain-containing protein [Gracilibacillus ureilyticus]|uniref:GyrI-like domain-containing protein n=1 Tax=Gracilibacillus ureilyticus TaxID=531814 RepID=UPI000B7E1877|nr:effector binding domain-containing protein [Gracilibacillus ureilyticus]
MNLSIINSTRTNNFNDKDIMQKITELWKEASPHLPENENTYGVYHEYESDYKGDYSLSIAKEDEIGSIEIPMNAKYKIFYVDTTDEQGVFHAWSNIWEQEEAGLIERAYTFDFEKYLPNGEIEIHIAIK